MYVVHVSVISLSTIIISIVVSAPYFIIKMHPFISQIIIQNVSKGT